MLFFQGLKTLCFILLASVIRDKKFTVILIIFPL